MFFRKKNSAHVKQTSHRKTIMNVANLHTDFPEWPLPEKPGARAWTTNPSFSCPSDLWRHRYTPCRHSSTHTCSSGSQLRATKRHPVPAVRRGSRLTNKNERYSQHAHPREHVFPWTHPCNTTPLVCQSPPEGNLREVTLAKTENTV